LIGRRGWSCTCISAELQIAHVLHIEGIHVIAYRHANVTGVTTQVVAGDYSSAAQGERIGGTEACYCQGNRCETKRH
jgi:hypothetical protein